MEGLKVLSYNELFSLVETTVVDMRKNFQKAVLSVMDAGPKDKTTAFSIMLYIFLFSIPFFLMKALLSICCHTVAL